MAIICDKIDEFKWSVEDMAYLEELDLFESYQVIRFYIIEFSTFETLKVKCSKFGMKFSIKI